MAYFMAGGGGVDPQDIETADRKIHKMKVTVPSAWQREDGTNWCTVKVEIDGVTINSTSAHYTSGSKNTYNFLIEYDEDGKTYVAKKG